ncbi:MULTISPECIES: oligopeptide ABC transporter permease OppC [Vibrio]|jgi:oligopeptide transport system permease protein|uniref:Oligopeptide transport system permease protein OppC n=5 Tax=Bacteria TaxID=2 RepID=A0A9X0R5M4_VIBME|nr:MULTISPECIES: oligopeptide ABC transporter permease OppC [Vibrio]EEX37390.1 oligopeptide transport system permease protein OppC [Vibrio metschnikovii CIP 69.14]EKO3557864.1 oligopeptide ABC transporter permease OppC [Vibrio metschnikovii]EKO3566211.1 oligopeptide ABC transporter permease OppC [Vibrio metschnikovii]EKO3567937.1 oligopeptide ABC transporter permease OppC [Vibrio metschnikovii]EKO3571017.1 oligopeptide ABC transporter permease OppC [Vibrio metschnikovii]
MLKKQEHLQAIEKFTENLEIEGRSLWQDARVRFMRNKAAMASLCILCFITLLVVFGPMLANFSYDETDWYAMHAAPSATHWFGTDALGRDLFVRTLIGGRISLMVGIMGAFVAVLIGTLYGAASGFIGGRTDRVMMRVLEILYAIPFMFLVIVLVTFFGRNIVLIFVAIGAIAWLDMARIVRGQTLSLRSKEFIEAAHVCGVSQWRIITRHIVPNVLGIVAVYSTLLIPSMILTESFLSFLGLGVQEPMTSWGALLQEGANTMEVAIWQLIFPATFMIVTLFCFNYVGDGLRDALDPKDR